MSWKQLLKAWQSLLVFYIVMGTLEIAVGVWFLYGEGPLWLAIIFMVFGSGMIGYSPFLAKNAKRVRKRTIDEVKNRMTGKRW